MAGIAEWQPPSFCPEGRLLVHRFYPRLREPSAAFTVMSAILQGEYDRLNITPEAARAAGIALDGPGEVARPRS